ncbi:NXPE family member 1-like [Ruditapes philippinarum]|uniref:NXPE family member 1-like n=1 Tax=Ruditapes philippinarum TaxID=129788 RepID=UPI00295AEEF9|nr:NXPE family member 1-like [Ruditapes philippinarum]
MLTNIGQRTLEQRLNVSVGNGDKTRLTIEKPIIPCSQYNITKLWQSRKATGFFYKGKWNFRNCLGFQQTHDVNCLKDSRLYLMGDSTLRAWYASIIKRFKCLPTTEKWQNEKWHKMAECLNKKLSFKAGWYPHAQPFFVGQGWDDVRYTLYSTSRRIDNIPLNERAIIVIQLYLHFVAFHHSVFKERMAIIRRSIERLFLKNKKAIVMIKGPHTFTNTPAGSVRLSDYFGFVYSKIIYEVFDGLLDRIVLLNNKDTTIARHEKWNHPPDDTVNYMIDQMLDYTCTN